MNGWFEAHCEVSTEDARKWPTHGTATPEEIGEMFGAKALECAIALRDKLPEMHALSGPEYGPFVWKEGVARYRVSRRRDIKGCLLILDAMEKQA